MEEDAEAQPSMSEGPSKGQLALLSIVAFLGMLLIGAAIGLLVGSDDRSDTAITAASVPTSRVEATPVADDVSPTTVSQTTSHRRRCRRRRFPR